MNIASAIADLSDAAVELVAKVNNLRQIAVQAGELTEQQDLDFHAKLQNAYKSNKLHPVTPTGKPPLVAPGSPNPGTKGPTKKVNQ